MYPRVKALKMLIGFSEDLKIKFHSAKESFLRLHKIVNTYIRINLDNKHSKSKDDASTLKPKRGRPLGRKNMPKASVNLLIKAAIRSKKSFKKEPAAAAKLGGI